MYDNNENNDIQKAFEELKSTMQNLSDSMLELREEFVQMTENPQRKTPNQILEEILAERNEH